MLFELAQKFWRAIPYRARILIIRATQAKFTVSVVALVRDPEGRVLLLEHYVRPSAAWGLPGGFVEPYEQPETAIVRELKEETGLELRDLQLVSIRSIRRHVEILYFANASGKPVVGSREVKDAGWFTRANLPDDLTNVQRELILSELSGSTDQVS